MVVNRKNRITSYESPLVISYFMMKYDRYIKCVWMYPLPFGIFSYTCEKLMENTKFTYQEKNLM
jgi:hypothetical protein